MQSDHEIGILKLSLSRIIKEIDKDKIAKYLVFMVTPLNLPFSEGVHKNIYP